MKDRYEFRTWDTCLKKMNYFSLEDLMEDVCTASPTGLFASPAEHHITMQCTGLKDKNGKLIFEGDDVEFHEEFGKVFWGEEGKWLILWPNTIHSNLFCFDNICEIIGNIYENPELMKVKDDE